MSATTRSAAPIPVLPTGEQYELRHGDQRAVATEVGAGLRSYVVAGREVLDSFAPEEMPTGGRGQVLLPWPNRIDGARYSFGGQTHQLPIGEARTGNASHGLTRWQPWRLIERSASSVVLGLTIFPQSGYPFALALELAYGLSDAGLTVRTTARNVGTAALPFGAGHHPYFTVGTARVDGAILHLPAASRLITNERMIPTGKEAVDGTPFDFRAPRLIGDTVLDTCYADLLVDVDGMTRIAMAHPDGATRLTLTLDAHYRFAQVYSGDNLPDPATRRRGLAIEPMTCPADAFNSGDGLRVLQPGESFSAVWGLRAD
jgi:aldose 1-epimerase